MLNEGNEQGEPLKSIVERYLREVEKARPLGRTKRATLTWISGTWLGEKLDHEVTSQLLVQYAQWRLFDECSGLMKPDTYLSENAR